MSRAREPVCRCGCCVGGKGSQGRVWGVFLAVCIMGLWAARAVAAGGGEHGEGHAASAFDLVFPVINFLLFVYVLKRAGGDAIRRYLEERRAQIIAALEAAAAAKGEAERLHAAVGERLGQVEAEAENLRRDLRASAEVGRGRRLKGASDAVARIKRDAELVADQEVRAAAAALRDETVNAAVAATVALLRRQIKGADQERFLADFVQEMQANR